jgi:tight adherence protein B
MLAAALTFLVVIAVVLAVNWVFLVRPEQADQAALKRRLGNVTGVLRSSYTGTLVKPAVLLSPVPAVDRILSAATFVTAPIQLKISAAGLRMSVGGVLLACAMAGAAAFLFVFVLTRHAWLGLLAASVSAWLPIVVLNYKARKRVLAFEEHFPEAIDLIARALRAGHAFTTGLGMVSDESQEPVAGEFRQLYEEQNFGRPMPEALRAFADRVPLLDARFFVTAVLTQRESGGNLSEILDNLASVIRERFKVKRQIRVMSAHARMTGWVLAVEPLVLAIVLTFVAPNSMRTLFTDPLGLQMIVGAVCLQTLGTLVIRRLVNIEY